MHLPKARFRDITAILDTLDIVAANGENMQGG